MNDAKSPAMTATLERLFGRTTAIRAGVCIGEPIGCGEPIAGFRDFLSRKEYEISGLCQACQDSVFGGDA